MCMRVGVCDLMCVCFWLLLIACGVSTAGARQYMCMSDAPERLALVPVIALVLQFNESEQKQVRDVTTLGLVPPNRQVKELRPRAVQRVAAIIDASSTKL